MTTAKEVLDSKINKTRRVEVNDYLRRLQLPPAYCDAENVADQKASVKIKAVMAGISSALHGKPGQEATYDRYGEQRQSANRVLALALATMPRKEIQILFKYHFNLAGMLEFSVSHNYSFTTVTLETFMENPTNPGAAKLLGVAPAVPSGCVVEITEHTYTNQDATMELIGCVTERDVKSLLEKANKASQVFCNKDSLKLKRSIEVYQARIANSIERLVIENLDQANTMIRDRITIS